MLYKHKKSRFQTKKLQTPHLSPRKFLKTNKKIERNVLNIKLNVLISLNENGCSKRALRLHAY